MQISKVMTS